MNIYSASGNNARNFVQWRDMGTIRDALTAHLLSPWTTMLLAPADACDGSGKLKH